MWCAGCAVPVTGRRRRFCSRTCANRFHRSVLVPFTCRCCGRQAQVRRADRGRRKYCSRQCYRDHFNAANLTGDRNGRWRGGRALSYGPDWKRIKAEIRARDRVCTACGKTPDENGRALDVHHLNPFRFSGDNEASNLVALCRSCHMPADDHGRSGSAAFLRNVGIERGPTKRELHRLEQKERASAGERERAHRQRRAHELHAAGASLRQIARALGVSHQTVANWLAAAREPGVPYLTRLVS